MSGKRAEKRRWSRDVTTVATDLPEGCFTRDATTIARTMARYGGPSQGDFGSGLRMILCVIDRAGTTLTAERKEEPEKARWLLPAELGNRVHRRESD